MERSKFKTQEQKKEYSISFTDADFEKLSKSFDKARKKIIENDSKRKPSVIDYVKVTDW